MGNSNSNLSDGEIRIYASTFLSADEMKIFIFCAKYHMTGAELHECATFIKEYFACALTIQLYLSFIDRINEVEYDGNDPFLHIDTNKNIWYVIDLFEEKFPKFFRFNKEYFKYYSA